MAQFEGSTTLLPEPFEVRKDAVDKAAPAARAAAERISMELRRQVASKSSAPEDLPPEQEAAE